MPTLKFHEVCHSSSAIYMVHERNGGIHQLGPRTCGMAITNRGTACPQVFAQALQSNSSTGIPSDVYKRDAEHLLTGTEPFLSQTERGAGCGLCSSCAIHAPSYLFFVRVSTIPSWVISLALSRAAAASSAASLSSRRTFSIFSRFPGCQLFFGNIIKRPLIVLVVVDIQRLIYPEDETRQAPPTAAPNETQIPAGVAVNNQRNKQFRAYFGRGERGRRERERDRERDTDRDRDRESEY